MNIDKKVNDNKKEYKFSIIMLSLATISMFFSSIMLILFGDSMFELGETIKGIAHNINLVLSIVLIILGSITLYLTCIEIKKYHKL